MINVSRKAPLDHERDRCDLTGQEGVDVDGYGTMWIQVVPEIKTGGVGGHRTMKGVGIRSNFALSTVLVFLSRSSMTSRCIDATLDNF